MFGDWKNKYGGLLKQFQREQNNNLRLLGELENLKLCKSCKSKIMKIHGKYL